MLVELVNKLRLSNPWRYKAPLLICWPYVMLGVCSVEPIIGYSFILLAYATLFGIAGLGYYINDWADIKTDSLAGKPNKVGELKLPVRIFILIILLSIAFIPWIFLPTNRYSYGLLVAEMVLFLIYSLPPFRLKEKGFWGILCDALYAYVIPSSLASITFFLIGESRYAWFNYFLVGLNAWIVIVGIRGILLHQILDYSNDLKSNVKTFVTQSGIKRAESIIKFLLPMEGLLFLSFLGVVSAEFYLLIPGYLTYCIVRFIVEKKKGNSLSITGYRNFSYRIFDDFYLDFLAIVLLVHLIINDWRYVGLLVVHLIFFRNFIKQIITSKTK